jgi:ABC-type lipoprotein export system ATPase subunit
MPSNPSGKTEVEKKVQEPAVPEPGRPVYSVELNQPQDDPKPAEQLYSVESDPSTSYTAPTPQAQDNGAPLEMPDLGDRENDREMMLEEMKRESLQDPMVQAIQREIGATLAPMQPREQHVPDFYEDTLGPRDVFQCVNLTKAYGKGVGYNEVIKGISFTVKEGEYIVIYGPSGSGKSTLLNLLAGLDIPTRGEIRMHNTVIEKFTDDELAFYHREEIGLVFQAFNLLPSLTVWENVAFPLMLAGAPLNWRRHEALKILDRFGLVDFANYNPSQLSGGQQQRVALARALVHDPELLLIDEPTGNLDSYSANIVIEEISRLHKQEDRTIILVTHSQVFLPYATRVFYIKDGNLLTSDEHNRINPVS